MPASASTATPATTLILGYGSPLRRDDAAGRRVAGAVAGWGVPGVMSLEVHQLTPELAEPLAGATLAIFVDAAVGQAGAAVEARPIAPGGAVGALAHAGDPATLLALARDLYGRAPESWLLTIPAADLELGEGLSPSATAGVADALGWVARRLGILPSALAGVPGSPRRCE